MLENISDYDDFFIASRDEAEEQIKNAEIFIDTIEKYLNQIYTDNDG